METHLEQPGEDVELKTGYVIVASKIDCGSERHRFQPARYGMNDVQGLPERSEMNGLRLRSTLQGLRKRLMSRDFSKEKMADVPIYWVLLSNHLQWTIVLFPKFSRQKAAASALVILKVSPANDPSGNNACNQSIRVENLRIHA